MARLKHVTFNPLSKAMESSELMIRATVWLSMRKIRVANLRLRAAGYKPAADCTQRTG